MKATTPGHGVCSWSLQPTDERDLAEKVDACGVSAVQLALDPVRTGKMSLEGIAEVFEPRGIHVLSGMMSMEGEDYSTLDTIRATGGIVPDGTWAENEAAAVENAHIARELALTLVTFHAGFVPEEPGEAREQLIARLRRLADIFGEQGVDIALETGQESAETLVALLTELDDRRIGVNFDPANIILYGMGDPIAAVATLAPWVRQVHVKDAIATDTPGAWGAEVPVGAGDVHWEVFFETVRSADIRCDFLIEREAGDARVEDVCTAAALLEELGVA